MSRSCRFSIVKFHKCLKSVRNYEDIERSKYLNTIIRKLVRPEELRERFEKEDLNEVKNEIFRLAAQEVNISRNTVYVFILKHYLQTGIGISDTFPDFYSKYSENTKTEVLSNTSVSQFLDILEIQRTYRNNRLYLSISYDDLVKSFDKIGLVYRPMIRNRPAISQKCEDSVGCVGCSV